MIRVTIDICWRGGPPPPLFWNDSVSILIPFAFVGSTCSLVVLVSRARMTCFELEGSRLPGCRARPVICERSFNLTLSLRESVTSHISTRPLFSFLDVLAGPEKPLAGSANAD